MDLLLNEYYKFYALRGISCGNSINLAMKSLLSGRGMILVFFCCCLRRTFWSDGYVIFFFMFLQAVYPPTTNTRSTVNAWKSKRYLCLQQPSIFSYLILATSFSSSSVEKELLIAQSRLPSSLCFVTLWPIGLDTFQNRSNPRSLQVWCKAFPTCHVRQHNWVVKYFSFSNIY